MKPGQDSKTNRPAIGRRGFIGGGLATAGAALIAPSVGSGGSVASAATAPARRSGSPGHPPNSFDQLPPDAQSLVPIPRGRIHAAVNGLDHIVRDVMRRSGVPGVAVAVVQGDRVLFAKGFGVRDVNTGKRVDKHTVFQLASVSKTLASTVVSGAVGRGFVKWTDPVVKYLPDFALGDPYATEHVTLANMFAHRSGLPEHVGDLLEDLGYSQEYILNRLRLEPLEPFRDTYAYTNFGLTAAAEAAAAAASTTWADLADDVLFGPVGMRASSFRYSDFIKESNRSAMHVRIDGKWVQKFTRDADPEAPAGGASSNVLDLARWMTVQLSGGRWKNHPVIDADALAETHLPLAISNLPSTPSSRAGFYGLGLNVGYTYSGRLRLSHSGAFAQGAATTFALLPAEDLGIVVLTNGMPIGVAEAISFYFFDLVEAGRIVDDWFSLFEGAFAPLFVNQSELAGKTPPAHPVPANADAFYVGTYANDYFGNIQITSQGGSLHLIIGPEPFDYPLEHWDGNLFAFFPTGENALGITAATFNPNAGNNQAASVTLEYYNETGLGTFVRE